MGKALDILKRAAINQPTAPTVPSAPVAPTPATTISPALQKRRQKELEMWKQWKSTGDPNVKNQLMKSFEPMVIKAVSPYTGRVPVPAPAIRATAKTWLGKAIDRYDPSKGSLHTFVAGYMPKVKSYVAARQNIADIPETRTWSIGDYKRAEDSLKSQLGREPTIGEISTQSGIPQNEAIKLQKELKPNLSASGETLYELEKKPSGVQSSLKFLRASLNDEQKRVYDMMFTDGIKSTGELAKRMGVSPAKASKVKGGILDLLQKEVYRRGD